MDNKIILITLIVFAGIGMGSVICSISYFLDKRKADKALREQVERKHFIIDVASEVVARIQTLDLEDSRCLKGDFKIVQKKNKCPHESCHEDDY